MGIRFQGFKVTMKGKKPIAEKVLAPARKLPAPAEPLLAFFPGPSPKTGPIQPDPGWLLFAEGEVHPEPRHRHTRKAKRRLWDHFIHLALGQMYKVVQGSTVPANRQGRQVRSIRGNGPFSIRTKVALPVSKELTVRFI